MRGRVGVVILGIVGLLIALGARPAAAESTLDAVRKRGYLNCGIDGALPGFSWRSSWGWTGLDVDMCRAVAAAVLGDASKVAFFPLTTRDRFADLQAGKIDLLARNSTVTLQRDAANIEIAAVNFYGGQAFAVPRKAGITAPSELATSKICVVRGTIHETNLTNWFGARRYHIEVVPFDDAEAMYEAFFGSRCASMTREASVLAAVLVSRRRQADYIVLPQTISREPLGLYVRGGDNRWSDIVRWSFHAMLAAEELNLSRNTVASERQSPDPDVRQLLGTTPGNGHALGLDEDWAYNIIRQVGNYGESFDRNLGARSSFNLDRGPNALWTKGGLMYPLPMR